MVQRTRVVARIHPNGKVSVQVHGKNCSQSCCSGRKHHGFAFRFSQWTSSSAYKTAAPSFHASRLEYCCGKWSRRESGAIRTPSPPAAENKRIKTEGRPISSYLLTQISKTLATIEPPPLSEASRTVPVFWSTPVVPGPQVRLLTELCGWGQRLSRAIYPVDLILRALYPQAKKQSKCIWQRVWVGACSGAQACAFISRGDFRQLCCPGKKKLFGESSECPRYKSKLPFLGRKNIGREKK